MFPSLSFLCILFALFSFSLCWGSDGHMIVAQVASSFLTSTTTTQVNKMLNGNTLAEIAVWPDNYDHTSQGSWSEHLHYVNLPDNAQAFNYSACFPPAQVPEGCVVTAIANMTGLLEQNLQKNYWQLCSESSDSVPPCYLSYLVHFFGDVHQPLHVAFGSDEGGNTFDVDYSGSCTNLHEVWDVDLITTYEQNNNVDWYDMAEEITSYLKSNPNVASDFAAHMDAYEFGDESFLLARNIVYNFSPGSVPANSDWALNFTSTIDFSNSRADCGVVIGTNYYERCMPVVMEQLAKGGYRLSVRLNQLYDPSF